MALGVGTTINKMRDHALTLGRFDSVNGHEPKVNPGSGKTAGIWLRHLGPARGASGLLRTSARISYTFRIYASILAEPADDIDPDLSDAVDAVVSAFTGDFELGGNVRCVDLLGAFGDPLAAELGYLDLAGDTFRIADITVPTVADDVWLQAP